MRTFYEYATSDPDRIAVIDPDGIGMSYADLLGDVNRVSNLLRSRGVPAEATVAALLPNSYQMLAVERGTVQLPLYFTPINWHLTVAEIAYILSDSRARVLFTAAPYVDLARAAAAQAGLPDDAVIEVEVAVEEPRAAGRSRLTGQVAGHASTTPLEPSAGQRMLYTSGTTGRPKGVRRPLRGVSPSEAASSSVRRAARYRADHEDGVFLGVAPMYHASPLAYADQALDVGHRIVLHERWRPDTVLRALEEHRVTWVYLVPLMMQELLALDTAERQAADLSALRSVLHTAAPCPPSVKRQMIDWIGPLLVEVYGGTEGSATFITSEEWLAHPGSVGRPLTGVSLRILNDDGRDVPTGEVGHIYFKNTELAFEYLDAPEKTAASRRNGYVTLGDLGRFDDDGYLYLADRISDVVVSGGVNIYPAEIEHALVELSGVQDACVVGIPSERWGEELKAFVVTSRTGPNDARGTALESDLRERIGGYKIPRQWEFVQELPRSASGKLLRRQVRDAATNKVEDGQI